MDKFTKQQIDTFNDVIDCAKRAIPTDHPDIRDDWLDDLKRFHEVHVKTAYRDGRYQGREDVRKGEVA